MPGRLRSVDAASVLCFSLAVLAGCASSEAERAAVAAGVYMNAYAKGDSDAVAAVTVPSKRDRPLEQGIDALARGYTGVTEAEVDGNWAIAGARVRLGGPISVVPILMRRTDEGWQVATIVPPGLTEVFSTFPEYPDQPPDRLKYMPTRRLTSRAWAEDESTPELAPGTPVELVLDAGLGDLGDLSIFGLRGSDVDPLPSTAFAFFKFTVSGFRRVHLTATSGTDAALRIQLFAPEGGQRASNEAGSRKRGDHFSETEGRAEIQMDLSNATYLVAVVARKGSRVRLAYDSTPRVAGHKPAP